MSPSQPVVNCIFFTILITIIPIVKETPNYFKEPNRCFQGGGFFFFSGEKGNRTPCNACVNYGKMLLQAVTRRVPGLTPGCF